MTDLSHKQEEALKHEKRSAIYEHLKNQTVPQTIGLLTEVTEETYAKTFYQVGVLIEAGLVEKAGDHPATYRVVER